MITIVRDIHNAVQNSRNTIEFLLEKTTRNWLEDYPVAVVHHKSRIENENQLKILEEMNFFDQDGYSSQNYSLQTLRTLQEKAPYAVKSAYCIALKEEQKDNFIFQEKFQKDKWKKVQDKELNFEALVSYSKFSTEDTSVMIETQIRNIMRSSKEIPSLKVSGFIWIVSLPKTTYIADILQHYFKDNHIYVERGRKITFIAWADRLADINMRYFVNTP
ncbi:MAG: hypothetical protein JXQ67_00315 [Campylobacterales bacterium]|nr:hypothetical protein [Campylobacterales bacterium]